MYLYIEIESNRRETHMWKINPTIIVRDVYHATQSATVLILFVSLRHDSIKNSNFSRCLKDY